MFYILCVKKNTLPEKKIRIAASEYTLYMIHLIENIATVEAQSMNIHCRIELGPNRNG